jgi:iron complex outermembrane receptor protein
VYPAGGPFYPTDFAAANGVAGDLDLAYRTIALGNRIDDVDTRATRAVVGLDGTHGDWDFGGAIVYSANRQSDRLVSGFVSQQRLLDAMATGLVNPFGASGAAGDALLAGTQAGGDFHDAHGTTWLAEARASGEVMQLPAGPLMTAFGGEWRREALDNTFSALAASGDVIGTGSVNLPSTSGNRDAFALYAEADVPIASGLESQLALRYDHYSDFGGTTNPKVALRWQPARTLLLRASWGTGFRAPALYDLDTPAQHGFTGPDGQDPLRCPTTGLPSDCLGGFPAIFGGNPDLQPETSEQVNGGIVWEPARGLALTADYWRIRKSNVIAPLPEDEVLAPGSPWAASNIVRGAIDPRYPDLPGPITSVILVNENIGRVLTDGVDVGVHWQGTPGRFGRLGFALDGTWIGKYQQTGADGITQSLAGNNDGPGPVPRWRHYASLDWSLGAWSATLAQTFQSSYSEIDERFCDDTGCPVRRRVGTYETWDAQVRTHAGHASVALGIRNLFDRAPPFTSLPSGYAGWYDASYADPRGRTYYATLSLAFH